MTGSSTAPHSSHYAPPQSPGLDMYSQGPSQTQMPPPMQSHNSFGHPQTPLSPTYHSAGPQQPHNLSVSMPQSSGSVQQFSGNPLFDPSDPALFNFDISSLNFGNQYGALEFGMLGQMSSRMDDGTGGDMLNSMNQVPNYQPYTESPAIMFGQDALLNADWQSDHPRANSTTGLLQTPHNTPIVTSVDRHESNNGFSNAYTIAAGPNSLPSASPATSVAGQDGSIGDPNSPALFATNISHQPSALPVFARQQPSKAQAVQPPQSSDMYQSNQNPRKRPFDVDTIYETVTKPYPYTAGFHRLFNFISRRFSSEKRLRIAKAISTVRPSLITFITMSIGTSKTSRRTFQQHMTSTIPSFSPSRLMGASPCSRLSSDFRAGSTFVLPVRFRFFSGRLDAASFSVLLEAVTSSFVRYFNTRAGCMP